MIKQRAASNILPNTLRELELLVLEALWQQPHLIDRIKQGHFYTYFSSVSLSKLLARLMGDVTQLLDIGRLKTILSSS